MVSKSRRLQGGLYVYGLCIDCNNKQSRFDAAYAEMAEALRPLWSRDWQLRVPDRPQLPALEIRPGAVASSVLFGMFGLNPRLRTLQPGLAAALVDGADNISLPDDLRLCVALARGDRARLSGSIAGMFLFGPRLDGRALGYFTHAQIYFPPLAWQLTSPERSLLDLQGWVDVSSWITYAHNMRQPLYSLCPTMPVVAHPCHHPEQADAWTEMFSDKITEIVECDYLPR